MTLLGVSLIPLKLTAPRKLAVAAVMLFAGTAMAGTINVYTGQDDGSPVGGPMPNSAAAQLAFILAANGLGSINTITFENLPIDDGSNPNLGSFAAAPGVTIVQSGPDYTNFGFPGYTGVSNTSAGNGSNNNLYAFNTTPGGANFLGTTPGGATFNFAFPINSFGLYLTGIQTRFTTSLTLTLNDGTLQSLSLPINVNGGAQYYGFTDSSSFSSVTLTDVGNDAWGVDDISYGASPVPEPSSLILLSTGMLGVAGAARRRFMRS